MRDDQEGRIPRLVEAPQQLQDLLAAGEVGRREREALAQADGLEELGGSRAHLRIPAAAVREQRHLDVLDGGVRRQQVMELNDEAELSRGELTPDAIDAGDAAASRTYVDALTRTAGG